MFCLACRRRASAIYCLVLIGPLAWSADLQSARAINAGAINAGVIELDAPIPAKGTLTFKLHTSDAWQNGAGCVKKSARFIKIPALAEASISQTGPAVGITWRWIGGPALRSLLPELPGNQRWFFQITWDSAAGKYDAFVNGAPITTPGVTYKPWEMAPSAKRIETFGDPVAVSDLTVGGGYLDPADAAAKTPPDLSGKHLKLFGKAPMPPPADLKNRQGRLLAEYRMDKPADVKDWVLEGPGKIEFDAGWMRMRSTRPDASGDVNGHIVYWCPHEFPASFVCQWDVQIVSDFGLTIVFFAARGENGQDIFDPSLPPRDGTFAHYTRGAVKSYHISYFASTPGTPGRVTSNLRKNNSFYLMSSGPVAIADDSRQVHRMRLIKDGAHIQMQIDGRVSIDYTDPGGDRYGPVYHDGKIGLRQMQWTVGQYRDFRVWELLPEEE